MDTIATILLTELGSLGIAAKEEKGEVYLRPAPPQHLAARLLANKDVLAQALWAKASRARQKAAIARLAADRRAWIEENKRLGLYRSPD